MSVNRYSTESGLQTLASGQRVWIGSKDAYDAEKQAGTLPSNCLIAITDDSEDNNYSTEEKLTGKFWIDDKPIYRQVQKLRSGLSIDEHWAPTWGLSFTDVDTITNAIFVQSTKCASVSIDGVGAQSYVKIYGLTGNTDNNSYMIFEYTKTTD